MTSLPPFFFWHVLRMANSSSTLKSQNSFSLYMYSVYKHTLT